MDLVVGADGSPSAEPTGRAAAEEARLRQARLHVIHVVYVPPPLGDGVRFVPDNLIDSSYEFAETVRTSVWERVKAQLEGSGLSGSRWIGPDIHRMRSSTTPSRSEQV